MNDHSVDVSVVIAAYNAEKWISETLRSVIAQTYRRYEILVVDDGSTDSTRALVLRFGQKVRYLSCTINGGQPVARNIGIRAAKGEYVAFLDADDLWQPDKLEVQMQRLKSDPTLAWIYADATVFDSNTGQVTAVVGGGNRLPEGDILERLLLNNFIPSPTPIVRRDVFSAIGYFDESPNLRIGEDWNMWLRIASRYPVGVVNQPLGKIRSHPSSMTACADPGTLLSSKLMVVENALERDVKRLGFVRRKALANVYNGVATTVLARGGDRRAVRNMFVQAWRLIPVSPSPYVGMLLSFLPRPIILSLKKIKRQIARWH